jgi:hypothetical protein
MELWESGTNNKKLKYEYQIWLKASLPFFSDLINIKDATSNERHCEMDNGYTGLHNICTGLHISFVLQSWRSSSLPKAFCQFYIKYDKRLRERISSFY